MQGQDGHMLPAIGCSNVPLQHTVPFQTHGDELAEMKAYMFALNARIFNLEEQMANMCQYVYELENALNMHSNTVYGKRKHANQDDAHSSKIRRMAPEDNVSKKKTKMCQNFSRGFCRYGESCAFAHGSDDLRSAQ